MRRTITKADVFVDGSTSPYIEIKNVGRVATWWYDEKRIGFDYSMKQFGLPIDYIYCYKSSIEDMIVRWWNGEIFHGIRLPKECNMPHGTNSLTTYEKMGFMPVDVHKDAPHYEGYLPIGWKRESQDALWSHVIDNQNNIRFVIFDACNGWEDRMHVDFMRRYMKRYDYDDKKQRFYAVEDTATKEIMFKTESTPEYSDSKLEQQCIDFLNTNFPQHEDLFAYWELNKKV